MSHIADQCRSVIFCGGTMSPLPETIKQLLSRNLISRSTSKSMNHVIEPENINLALLSSGPSGTNLNFSFESRNDMRMIQELGIIITNYARVIPAGLVVFFTSFSYMEHVMHIWESSNILNGINSIKNVRYYYIILFNLNLQVFFEKKGEAPDIMLQNYERTIISKKGAILFAVMGGKLSEGINFSDDLGRGIITVGLPYPNVNEIETKEQMNAYIKLMLESGSEKTRKQLEADFLESCCMRIMNQTIGKSTYI